MSARQPHPDEPEYLQDGGSAPPGARGRRGLVLATVVAAVAGLVGLGGWAAASLMSTGSKPAEVVPANAIGFWSIDLDPSADQKVEAVRLLQKFPALREELDISDRDDLRRWAFERAIQDGSCAGADYDTDVAPWIGERLAVAGVPSGPDRDAPVPLVAVQVTDADAAVAAIERLAACSGADDVGVAVVGDYALVSDSEEHADEVARSVEKATLAEDPDYRKWMKRVGDPGIVSMYVAPGAMAYLSEVQEQMADRLAEQDPPGWAGGPAVPGPDMAAMRRQVERLSGDFEGMAAVLRFADGAVEVEAVGESTSRAMVAAEDRSGVAALPSGTAVALGVSLSDGWAQAGLDMLGELSGADGADGPDAMLRDAEAMTGLRLPEDLQRLLGDGFAVAVGADLRPGSGAGQPAPVGVRVSGDPAEITDVVDRLTARFGPQADLLAVAEGDGVVAMGLDRQYVAELAGQGSLGSQDGFRDVVPESERAGFTLYVDFDAVERWAAEGALPGGPADPSTLANLEPLKELGLSSWLEDDGSERGLLRLTTD